MDISSSKPSVDFSQRLYGEVRPTATYTVTLAWAMVTGFTLTIPETGRYRIRAQGDVRPLDNANLNYVFIRLYNATSASPVPNSAREFGLAIGNSTSIDGHFNMAGDWEETFTAGTVIQLQAYTNGAGLGPQIRYAAGQAELLFSYELVNKAVPVSYTPPVIPGIEIGEIKMWPTAVAPVGYLLCDGASYSTGLYADLFAVIGYAFGGGGATFNVPDFRGASPAGVGTPTGYVYNEAIALATKYDDQFQWHAHAGDANTGGSDPNGRGFTTANGFPYAGPPSYPTSALNVGPPLAAYGGYGTPRVGYTTRGKLLGINFIIKT